MWLATRFLSAPQMPGAQQPKGEQTQRGSPAHVRLVLAVECPCVTLSVLGCRISLASLRSAPTRAAPEHRVALMAKAPGGLDSAPGDPMTSDDRRRRRQR